MWWVCKKKSSVIFWRQFNVTWMLNGRYRSNCLFLLDVAKYLRCATFFASIKFCHEIGKKKKNAPKKKISFLLWIGKIFLLFFSSTNLFQFTFFRIFKRTHVRENYEIFCLFAKVCTLKVFLKHSLTFNWYKYREGFKKKQPIFWSQLQFFK